METIKLREEYIKLGQALKAVNFVESGVEAEAGHIGRTCEGKRECRDSAGKKTLRRRHCAL